MPTVKLEFCACLTITQFKALPNPRAGYWWIARKTKHGLSFVKNLAPLAGYYAFTYSGILARGNYVLGCGSFRHHFKVN